MYIFKIDLVISENVRIAFLYVLSICNHMNVNHAATPLIRHLSHPYFKQGYDNRNTIILTHEIGFSQIFSQNSMYEHQILLQLSVLIENSCNGVTVCNQKHCFLMIIALHSLTALLC